MEIYPAGQANLRFISDIKPDAWYGKGCFANFIFHRGRNMQEALLHDPLAPKGRPHPTYLTRTIYLGSSVIEYISSYSDAAISVAEEVDQIKKASRVELNREIETIKRRLIVEHEAALKSIGDTREAILNLVSNHLASSVIDITQATKLHCGVYFLKDQGEIVYVGQSISVYNRVSQHKSQNFKKFDSVTLLPCKPEELNNLEGFFIRLLKPKLNGHSRDGVHGAPSSWLWGEVVHLDVRMLDWVDS